VSRLLKCYAECHYTECRYVECRYADYCYAVCLYAECKRADCYCPECRVADCRGTLKRNRSQLFVECRNHHRQFLPNCHLQRQSDFSSKAFRLQTSRL